MSSITIKMPTQNSIVNNFENIWLPVKFYNSAETKVRQGRQGMSKKK